MAFLKIENVKIKGVAACVPDNLQDNMDYSILSEDERKKYIDTTGVHYRHVTDKDTCTSDLCLSAAEKLIADLNWKKEEIEALVFVSQTPDYKMPTTACVLQNRLGLKSSTLSFDISLGCSGYVYGLSVISSLVSSGNIKRALLLVGNTQSKNVNYRDKSTYLLFGDAGTATALEYNPAEQDTMLFHLQTYGDGMNSIIIPDGMYRNPVCESSFVEYTDEEGNVRTPMQLKMDGMDVFSFVISKVPKCIKGLIENYQISDDMIDFYFLHHANKFLMEKLRKKLKFAEEKTPYNIENFGNSSGACVPLLMVTNCKERLENGSSRMLFSGFGVGLSVGAGYLTTKNLVVSDLILYKK
ncbi:3-oxoacyl-ACP synthase III family protein [Parabacteroides distasonis]|uniref:3-oxoacyl-ACP synthase III family protein n=2 Tax=Parabacteroides distasonis TaxID=823 RepID=UPI0018A0F903|nr:ketoacyl-ACP synthase III [Parabacteroides distasonis]MDB9152998.1 ketoacyl-ACP synthase III [Parabacteroides distasonis]MDB9157677.1 ketoacyl-ACP synthase III [Parabacteroides distasonis]MDB9166542.1 ketoacyl-ACP synthase III [Parabacteroides distasonis]MDB9170961.1 ketoacyl-ACP synthase III [Parabacteroides distasonis]